MPDKIIDKIFMERGKLSEDIEKVKFEYEYPLGLDLHPKSSLSKFICNEISERVLSSKRVVDQSTSEWEKMDWTMTAYMPKNEEDKRVSAEDWRRPVNVVIPMTFASMEMYLTYMSSAFFQDTIHRFRGCGGKEDIIGAALLERLVARQNMWFKEQLKLTNQWRDAFMYGIGVVAPQWRKHKGAKLRKVEVDEVLTQLLGGTDVRAAAGDIIQFFEEGQTLFEGNSLLNIDPFRYLPDPSVSACDVQDGEFVGWQSRTNAMNLLTQETDPEERMFNAKYVRLWASQGRGTSMFYNDVGDRYQRTGSESVEMFKNLVNVVDLTTMYIKLVPREWGLGDEDYPEIWQFTVAADHILIQANPLGLDHNMFPVSVCAPNSDGRSVLPVSYLMTTYGLQMAIDWFMKSHFDNVCKTMNDMVLINPEFIEYEDMKRGGPGKLIRTRNVPYNATSLDAFMKQFVVQDVTRNHVNDVSMLTDLLRQVNGTVDITMGDLSKLPERPTATGIQAAQTGALSRLQRIAQIISVQSMRDIAWQEAYNTLQFMDEPMAVSILGRHEDYLKQEFGVDIEQIDVSVFDLSPNFDVEPHSGALPQKDDLQVMSNLISMLVGVEGVAGELVARVDIPRLMMHYVKKAGFENIHEFMREAQQMPQMQPQIMPDDQVAQGVDNGQLVPVGGGYD